MPEAALPRAVPLVADEYGIDLSTIAIPDALPRSSTEPQMGYAEWLVIGQELPPRRPVGSLRAAWNSPPAA